MYFTNPFGTSTHSYDPVDTKSVEMTITDHCLKDSELL